MSLRSVTSVAALAVVLLAGCGGTTQHDPKLAQQELSAGLAAHYAGRIDQATTHYKKALDYDPNNKWAFYNLGVIEQNAGHLDTAEKDYREAIRIDPGLSGALYNLAIIVTKHSPQEGEALYRRAIAADPKNGPAHLNLGFLLGTLGKNDEAQAEFNAAVALDPTFRSRVPQPTTPSPSPSAAR